MATTRRTFGTHLSSGQNENRFTGHSQKTFVEPAKTRRAALGDIKNTLNERTLAGKTGKPATTRTALGVKQQAPGFKTGTSRATSKNTSTLPPVHGATLQRNVEELVAASKQQTIQPFSTEVSQPQPMDLDTSDAMQELSETLSELHVLNIDEPEPEDETNVSEYTQSIYNYLRKLEVQYHVPPSYISAQTDLNEKMRHILLDWLVEVHLKFRLMQETLFMTASIIDRYLSKKLVRRQELQLVGMTAMLIAAKVEEIYAPEVHDFCYISDHAYAKEDVIRMEKDILLTLKFEFSPPTCMHFLRRSSKAAMSDIRTHTLAKYICELSLLEYRMLRYTPSLIAAGATFIAQKMIGHDQWTPTLQHYTGYSEKDLQPCVTDLLYLLQKAPQSSLQAVSKKYSHRKFMEVAAVASQHLYLFQE
eukprot:GCRY01005981.1.p1 GENE.GCRY01005981.1~~GCRY01005981.1.p1  ORF type:complete len:419 (+),score=75.31 GCRY01005981.1:138-1394(+)